MPQSSRTIPASVAGKLYAAADVISEKGLADTKIEEIAAATGVPKATLYYYFTGKDDILAFLLKHSLDSLAGEVAEAADAPGLGRDRLVAVITVQIEHTLNNAGASRAFLGDLGRAVRLPELAQAVQEAFYEPISRVLDAGAADGSLRALDDPRSAAVSIFGSVMMTAMLNNITNTGRTAREVADGVIDLIMEGLAPNG